MTNANECDNESNDDDESNDCQKPCDPQTRCPYCADYWERMRVEGFWNDTTGWTDKGMKEMLK